MEPSKKIGPGCKEHMDRVTWNREMKEQESLAAFDRHLLESPTKSDQQSVHARHKLEQDLVVPMELQEAITFSKGYVLAWTNRQDEIAKLWKVIRMGSTVITALKEEHHSPTNMDIHRTRLRLETEYHDAVRKLEHKAGIDQREATGDGDAEG